jgi:nucleoside phosphorylase
MSLDTLIITAVYDELLGLLDIEPQGSSRWIESSDSAGFPYHLREFPLSGGDVLKVAAAWTGAMGKMQTAGRARDLINFLKPLSLAMCGICAGRRGDVFLGDVIVADRVYSYDHGKLIAENENGHRVETIFHDIETYNLDKTWAVRVPYFAREWKEDWHKDKRPLSLENQRRWLLKTLYAHLDENDAHAPRDHPERDKHCPNYENALASLQKDDLLILDKGKLALSEKGYRKILDERARFVNGPPADPPFRVHLGPIATGETVRQDPDLFPWLARATRKVLGVEMEAAAVGWVAELSGIPSIIAKAVSDYGDKDKDDRYHEFACRASAEFLIKFLSRYPPRSLNRNKVVTALVAAGHQPDKLAHAPHKIIRGIGEGQPKPEMEEARLEAKADDGAMAKIRAEQYADARTMVLVHLLTPSNVPGQIYDIVIYAKRHKDRDISDVDKAEFFFGKHWANQVFTGIPDGNRIGVKTSAYGPFLCTCKITFKNGPPAILYRYIDFEMGEVVSKLLQKE